MIHFLPNNPETLALLIAGQQLLKDPSRWCQGSMKQGQSYCINGALFEVGTPNYQMPEDYVSDDPLYYRGDLQRGQIPEPFWFVRQALKVRSTYDNVGLFNDDPETTHEQVLELLKSSIALVEGEIESSVLPSAQMNAQRKSKPAPSKHGAGDSERGGRMTKRPKVELVPVEADSDTQRVLERLDRGTREARLQDY